MSALLVLAAAGFAAAPPNVVLIVADDLGWADVGYHDARARTPQIDRLIAGGVELDRFYVAPVCSPTRAGLMTGRYPIRYGMGRAVIPPYRDFGLPAEERTLPEALAAAVPGGGYERRAAFGKWHLGHLRPEWHPLRRGFTHFRGHYNGAIDYFTHVRDGERDWHVDRVPSDEPGYSTDLIAGAAADWIADAAAGEAPYFCYVPFNAPHSPFQAREDDLARFADLGEPGANGRKRRALAAMIWRMDLGIGRILEAVERTGEAENTLIWFASDNGGIAGLPDNNAPLRGAKASVFEGGIRVPAGVRWPARFPAGTTRTHVCGYVDVLPTLLAAAGAAPDDRGSDEGTGRPLDGVDLTAYLAGEVDAPPERAWYSYIGQQGEAKEQLAVTADGWKLVVTGPRLDARGLTDDHRRFLFRIDEDPGERRNLAAERPAVVARLAALLVAHRALQPADAVPPYRTPNPGFVPPKDWRIGAE